jgi:hypothetical protein
VIYMDQTLQRRHHSSAGPGSLVRDIETSLPVKKWGPQYPLRGGLSSRTKDYSP